MSEHDEQAALFDWAAMNKNRLPELELMFAIPNGGQRHKAVATKMKAEGVKAGVPDIFLPVARNSWNGLFIEMKFGKNKLTKNQEKWKRSLIYQGFTFKTCWGWLEAANTLEAYLGAED